MSDSTLKEFLRKGKQYLELKDSIKTEANLHDAMVDFMKCSENLLRGYLADEAESRRLDSQYVAMYSEETDQWLVTEKKFWTKHGYISDEYDPELELLLLDNDFNVVSENGFEYDGDDEAESVLKDLGFEIMENPWE